MKNINKLFIALGASIITSTVATAAVIPAQEDIMTSGFFTGGNTVRGYDADDRNVHRVSTPAPFNTPAAETIYIKFDPTQFTDYTSPVTNATLTVQSVDGGFNNNASAATPFSVSAHPVNADPISEITDDTNPTGTIAWSDFYNNNILDADAQATTNIDGFGPFDFDITSIVNQWIDGSNTDFYIALTGKNDTSGNSFLHGFTNNSETPGSTYITIPEPTSLILLTLPALTLLNRRK